METWGSPYLGAHAAYLRLLGSAPGVEARESDGVYAVRTRVQSNSENVVLSGADAQVTPALAAELAGWFAEWELPASWICAEGPRREQAVAALESAGYKAERAGWEMRARISSLDLGSTGGAGVRIERVSTPRGLEDWLDVAGACGWFEGDPGRVAMRDHYAGLGLGEQAALRHYVARRAGVPVGMASAFFGGEAIVLAAVGVLPDLRRQGIGRALALLRLREARDRGCRLALLAPSPDGDALYETLGFESHRQPPDRWFHAPSSNPGPLAARNF